MSTRKTLRIGIAGLVACSSLLLAGCSLDDDSNSIQTGPVSFVSLYNASPDAPDLDVVVDNRQVDTGPFEYADNTGYLRFFTGNRNLKITPAGANNVAVDTTIQLKDQYTYSLFVVGSYQHAELLVVQDTAATPGSGKAMVRFINLSPDAAPVELKVKDAEGSLTESQSFKEITPFIEVDAKKYNFEVVSVEDSAAPLSLPDTNFRAGAYYTIIVRGYKIPPAGNTNVLSAEVVEN